MLSHVSLAVSSFLSAQPIRSCSGRVRLCRCGWWLCSCTAGSGLSSTKKTCKSSAAPPQPGPLCIPAHSTPTRSHLVPGERSLGVFQNRADVCYCCFVFFCFGLKAGTSQLLTVASSTSSPRDAILRIQMAEVRGGCKVQQISGSRGFDLGVPREEGRPGSNTSEADLRWRWCWKS